MCVYVCFLFFFCLIRPLKFKILFYLVFVRFCSRVYEFIFTFFFYLLIYLLFSSVLLLFFFFCFAYGLAWPKSPIYFLIIIVLDSLFSSSSYQPLIYSPQPGYNTSIVPRIWWKTVGGFSNVTLHI